MMRLSVCFSIDGEPDAADAEGAVDCPTHHPAATAAADHQAPAERAATAADHATAEGVTTGAAGTGGHHSADHHVSGATHHCHLHARPGAVSASGHQNVTWHNTNVNAPAACSTSNSDSATSCQYGDSGVTRCAWHISTLDAEPGSASCDTNAEPPDDAREARARGTGWESGQGAARHAGNHGADQGGTAAAGGSWSPGGGHTDCTRDTGARWPPDAQGTLYGGAAGSSAGAGTGAPTGSSCGAGCGQCERGGRAERHYHGAGDTAGPGGAGRGICSGHCNT